MKRQLDRLKGKRLVTGDPNLMTKDEICINATSNGVEVKEIGTDGSIKDIASGNSENTKKEYEYYRITNSFNEWSESLYIIFHMTWIDSVIDEDTKERIYGELSSPVSGYTAIAKIRKGVYKNIPSYDDRRVGIITNFSQMGTPTFKEILNAVGYDDENFNKTFTALTPEEITEIENKITFRDPLI